MGRIIDITGKTFGKWKVIEFAGIISRAAYWLCKCECGTERIVNGKNLRRGVSKDCGCGRKETSGRPVIDLTGMVYGRLTVLRFAEMRYKMSYWVCKCECGKETITRGRSLRIGETRSCGCLGLEIAKECHITHGLSKVKYNAYRVWEGIGQRCNNPNHTYYHHYGGRGITVCPEWDSFERFLADMGERPSPKHTIDRIDNNGNYCKDNCRWATWKEQGRNRRNNRLITIDGETRTLAEWSEELGISRNAVLSNCSG